MSSARLESRRFLAPLGFLLVFLLILTWIWPVVWPASIPLFTLASLLWFGVRSFFRDPERVIPAEEKLIVSAADGLVVGVEEVAEAPFQLGSMRRISVFLSVWDIHVNRAPVTGLVRKSVYHPGQFLDVRHPEASLRNENRVWLLETAQGPVVVRQIAGLIARRIVAWNREGDEVKRGERIGMIRFGSRTEVFLPLTCTVLVRPGERVKGASTVLARWP